MFAPSPSLPACRSGVLRVGGAAWPFLTHTRACCKPRRRRYCRHRHAACASFQGDVGVPPNQRPAETAGWDGSDEAPQDFDTIAAIVTGAQQGAVSIIRISGAGATGIAAQLFCRAGTRRRSSSSESCGSNGAAAWLQLESHRIYYGSVHEEDGSKIDEVLLLCMLGPRSYTAEDVVEIHTHGGGICAQRVLQRCLQAGARLARPGEFTLRAFLNGRLDLSQAESVSELIGARTVAAADSALAGLAGGLGREVQQMRAECLDLLTELDARLDFDEDLPALDVPGLERRIGALAQRVQSALSTARQGQLLRTGLQVALVGRPNVGKSSLLNALSGTERAIVTEIAGTTRDIVEAGIVMDGIPITLLDTAGLREASDKVERIGVERTLAAARQADIVVMVMDAQAGWTVGDQEIFRTVFGAGGTNRGFDPYASGGSYDSRGSDSEDEAAAGAGAAAKVPALLVVNKVDLAQAAEAAGSCDLRGHCTSSWETDDDPSAAATTAASPVNGAAGAAAGVGPSPAGQPGAAWTAAESSDFDPYASGSSYDSRGESDTEAAPPAPAAAAAAGPAPVPPQVAAAFSQVVETSAATGQGLRALKRGVLRLAGAPQLAPGGVAWAVNERQAEALIRAEEALQRVQASVGEGLPMDFWTIDLRGAALALGEVSGDDVTEEILDNIFSRFCIGK